VYLHLGQSIVVPESTVIGIFDLDNTTSSHITRKFLSDAEKSGCVVSVSDELPRSFVVCCEEEKSPALRTTHFGKWSEEERNYEMTIYLSQLSSQTLMKRSNWL